MHDIRYWSIKSECVCKVLTRKRFLDKDEVVKSKAETEEEEEPVVVIGHAAIEPHAVVVKSGVAALAELTVLCPLWNHNLRARKKGEMEQRGREGASVREQGTEGDRIIMRHTIGQV